MKISIICPLYKGEKYVDKIIEMINRNFDYCKTYIKNISVELIFINDYPNEHIQINKNTDINIFLYQNEINRGIHYSRVYGVNVSKGEYILFLDQDDEIVDEFLYSQLSKINDADAIICNGYNKGREIYSSQVYIENACKMESYLNGENLIVSPGQVILKRKAVESLWAEKILKNNGADDYFLWLLMFITEKTFTYNNELLYKHVTTGVNTSNNFEQMTKSVLEVIDYLWKNKMITEQTKENIAHKFNQSFNVAELEYRYKRGSKILEILDIWLSQKENNRTCKKYLYEQGINSIVIYGCGVLGKHLAREMIEAEIKIDCIMDRKLGIAVDGIDSRKIGDNIDDSAVIVITPVVDIKNIESVLRKFYKNRIIHVSEIVENME